MLNFLAWCIALFCSRSIGIVVNDLFYHCAWRLDEALCVIWHIVCCKSDSAQFLVTIDEVQFISIGDKNIHFIVFTFHD